MIHVLVFVACMLGPTETVDIRDCRVVELEVASVDQCRIHGQILVADWLAGQPVAMALAPGTGWSCLNGIRA